MYNLIYICPKYPFPASTGEDHNLEEHIKELSENNNDNRVKVILFNFKNTEIEKFKYNIEHKIFNTKYGNLENKKFVKQLLYFIFSILPFKTFPMERIKTKEAIKYINKIQPETIIIDTLTSSSLLPAKKIYNLIYIAHNVEHKLAKDTYKLQNNIFLKLYYYLLYLKIKKIEKSILEKSDKIICISTSDYKYFNKIYPRKTEFLPHKINIQKEKWQGKNKKTLFFCGPLYFKPNFEAVKWIVEELSPILSKDIKIKIAGKGTENISNDWKRENIEFLGFVSKEKLLDLYRNSSAFLCPIVYGSGVKIKVLEALGFATPIIATQNALEGLDYIKIEPLIDRNNLIKTKENIESLLYNQKALENYSKNLNNQLESYQKENNISLKNFIEK